MRNAHKAKPETLGTPASRFVLEAVDLTTQCIVRDAQFDVLNPQVLANLIKMPSISLHRSNFLDPEGVSKINAMFGLSFEITTLMEVTIRQAELIDQLPYKVHTNRELILMLAGEKPLASFMGSPAVADSWEIPEKYFDPYVAEGRFRKHDERHVLSKPDARARNAAVRHVLYALSGEEWRINEYRSLLQRANMEGWSELLTRKQGSLLGYADWQNDAFIERIYRPSLLKRQSLRSD
jgi:hypothetical protein